MKEHGTGRVLIVDDDEALAAVYAAWLEDHYPIETATSGQDALDALDADVAVILLDRRMPGLPGEAVLQSVREEGYNCRVAMVTGVRPDTDVVDMGFDDYLVKPVDGDDLRALVDRMFERQTYDERLQAYYSLAAKRAALAAEVDHADRPGDLEAGLQTVDDELQSVQAEMTQVVDSFGFDDFRVAFRDLPEGDGD